MVRQRKLKRKEETSSSIPKKDMKKKYKDLLNKTFPLIIIFSALMYFYRRKHPIQILPINTPLDAPLAVTQKSLDVPERYWGTYRPGLYFGTKTRSANSLDTGLIWFQHELHDERLKIRHWCDQNNKLPKYGWFRHDGVNFGEQQILDDGISVNTTFVKRHGGHHGGDWSAKISITPTNKFKSPVPISILYYVSTDQPDSFNFVPYISDDSKLDSLEGMSDELGKFLIRFPKNMDSKNIIHSSYLVTRGPGLQTMSDIVEQMVIYNQNLKKQAQPQLQVPIGLPGHVKLPHYPGEPNVFIHEITIIPPHNFEVTFESASNVDRAMPLSGQYFDDVADKYRAKFDDKFEDVFGLKSKNFTDNEEVFAKAALSNMLGGIGYFTGKSLVQSSNNPIVEYWLTSLYTAVPSRSFFPRGFLWDEGFHNLLISRWNDDISRDIIAHWLDLMNVEGWIPREVILGNEAQAKVPQEFVVQKNSNANPPTFFLTIQSMMRHMTDKKSPKNREFLGLILPRLEAIYAWMNTSQVGKSAGTYYWRGRNQSAIFEVNPKTLASGLDDFPRASHPTDDETHLDLRCWMALASSVLAEIAELLGRPHEAYAATERYLTDNKLLDATHWSEEHGRYLDYGLHSDDIKLVRPPSPPTKHGQRPERLQKVRRVVQPPKLQFVNNFGYVSLFPFLLQIVDPQSPKLGKILDGLTDRELLWTNFGLRSLSKDSPLYMKRNTENDPPYWRGPIWINLNFLAIRALHHYGSHPGPHQARAGEIYEILRSNVISNMFKEYQRTGYVWEQYNDKNGRGQGVHPFTGWSSLVVLIMSEKY